MLHKLINKVFGEPTNDIVTNTYTESKIGNKSFYIGAFDNEKLIGFNLILYFKPNVSELFIILFLT